MYAVTGILAALRHAERTGIGQRLDIALLDCQVAMLANQAMNYLVSGTAPGRLGNAHPNIAPYQVFATTDGFLVLAVGNDSQFRSFCEAAGLDAIARDRRFADNASRVAHRDALTAAIAPAMARHTTAAWVAMLESAKVPCGPINCIDGVFQDAQVQARGLRHAMVRGDGDRVDLVASPLRLSATPPVTDGAPPLLGEQTEAVLSAHLGLDSQAIAALRNAGVIA
jgi:crotonobetainyl-CoA:carnitine CoA-transferase CaiB-like acyl-CoA transferase